MREHLLLIIEDDDGFFGKMERELQARATQLDVNIKLVRAISLTGAKRAMREEMPDAISIDMMFPMWDHDKIEAHAGAHFIGWMLGRFKVPHLMYTSSERKDVVDVLTDLYGVEEVPPILYKSPMVSHGEWAKRFLELTTQKAP